MESKCTNIKTSIDSLLAQLNRYLSHSNNQGLQEQVCNSHLNSAMFEGDLAEKECQTESDHTNHIDSVHTKHRKKAHLVGRFDFEMGNKCLDRDLTHIKKDLGLNYSIDDQFYENAHSHIQPVEDLSINICLKNVQTRPHIKENDQVKNDTNNNLIVQTIQNDRNQDSLEFPKKFDRYDKDLINNYIEANSDIINYIENDQRDKDKIKNKKKDFQEANKDKIKNKKKDFQEANKDKIKNKKKDFQEANKDKIKNQMKENQKSNKDKIKEQKKANKDRIRNQQNDQREFNKDKIRNQYNDQREFNKDKIKNKKKDYQESNKDKIINQQKVYRKAIKDKIRNYNKDNSEKLFNLKN